MLRRGGYLPWVGVQSNFGVPGSAASTPSTSDGTTFANSLAPNAQLGGSRCRRRLRSGRLESKMA